MKEPAGQTRLFGEGASPLRDVMMTLRQASLWASEQFGREISESNIGYLVQYGKVQKHGERGAVMVSQADLQAYYRAHLQDRPEDLKRRLGSDLNWDLSFDHLREKDTTKHVHRLHPYKGKFIPQLVEYFLDAHTDEHKQQVFFRPGDVVLDPFCGSGTTLVQATELGLHAVGVDVSTFNAQIATAKLGRYDLDALERLIAELSGALESRWRASPLAAFDRAANEDLKRYNAEHFPSPEIKRQMLDGRLDEQEYGPGKAEGFLRGYERLALQHGLRSPSPGGSFLENWFTPAILEEIRFLQAMIAAAAPDARALLEIVLTRTMRSVRATTHFDLGTLKEPVVAPYYCFKHKKICRPLATLMRSWRRYAKDTLARVRAFAALRTDTLQQCVIGDSRTVDLATAPGPALAELIRAQGIRGIFSSPPYVGVIDYHEQHAYAYELLGLPRRDDSEIGPLYSGSGKAAQQSYVAGIAAVLLNCKRFLQPGFDIFLVANDRHDLYPSIALQAGLRIVNRFKRPVLNRSERDSAAYAETIFHLRAR